MSSSCCSWQLWPFLVRRKITNNRFTFTRLLFLLQEIGNILLPRHFRASMKSGTISKARSCQVRSSMDSTQLFIPKIVINLQLKTLCLDSTKNWELWDCDRYDMWHFPWQKVRMKNSCSIPNEQLEADIPFCFSTENFEEDRESFGPLGEFECLSSSPKKIQLDRNNWFRIFRNLWHSSWQRIHLRPWNKLLFRNRSCWLSERQRVDRSQHSSHCDYFQVIWPSH